MRAGRTLRLERGREGGRDGWLDGCVGSWLCAAPDASMELAGLKGNCGKFAWSNGQGQAIRNRYCNDRCCGHYNMEKSGLSENLKAVALQRLRLHAGLLAELQNTVNCKECLTSRSR